MAKTFEELEAERDASIEGKSSVVNECPECGSRKSIAISKGHFNAQGSRYTITCGECGYSGMVTKPPRSADQKKRDAAARKDAAERRADNPDNPVIEGFAFEHLPEHVHAAAKPVRDLAATVFDTMEDCPQRREMLKDLLRAQAKAIRLANGDTGIPAT